MIMKFNTLFKRVRDQKGFTLVELIVVMAILAVLAALAVPRFATILEDSKYNAHNQNVIMIYKAGQMYVTAQGNPTEAINLGKLKSAGYITDANLKTPYDSAVAYTIEITTAGAITVTPGLATKADKAWSKADSYTGEEAAVVEPPK